MRDGIAAASGGVWRLAGVAGHVRYVERREKTALDAASPPLGRREASRAALIPIRKSAAWWALPQDERRAIFEQRSRHIADSMAFLPRVARRLYHARDLGQPFDFLTWFEFAPEHAPAFDELLAMLRAREEWTLRRARGGHPPVPLSRSRNAALALRASLRRSAAGRREAT